MCCEEGLSCAAHCAPSSAGVTAEVRRSQPRSLRKESAVVCSQQSSVLHSSRGSSSGAEG